MEEEDADPRLPDSTEIPPSGRGTHIRTGGSAPTATATGTAPTGVIPPVVTHLRFGTPDPPTIPIRDGGEISTGTIPIELHNRFAPLRQQGANLGEQDSLNLSSEILRGGSTSNASSSRGSRGRDPIPLTPEISYYWTASNRIRGSKHGFS